MKPTLDAAVRLLARRSHGRAELAKKLAARGHDDHAVEAAFARLEELGYLGPDDEIARRFAEELARKTGATPRSVAAKLAARGFEDAERAAQAAFLDWDPRSAASMVIAGEKNPDRAARRLSRRGFPADVIAGVVERLRNQAKSPHPDEEPAE